MKQRHQPYVATLELVKEGGVAKEGDGDNEKCVTFNSDETDETIKLARGKGGDNL